MERIGGTLHLKLNGKKVSARGNFTYNLGRPKRDSLTAADNTVPGYKETPQIPMIEGEIYNTKALKVRDVLDLKDATIILEIPADKSYVLREGIYAGEGNIQTEEGNMEVRFEGAEMDEV